MALDIFRGLINVADPVRAGDIAQTRNGSSAWLTTADNVNITGSAGIERRQGFTKVLPGAFDSSYATLDQRRMYVVGAGDLLTVRENLSTTVLASGFDAASISWSEFNGQVFGTNGAQSFVISENNAVIPWAWPVPDAPVVAALNGDLPAGQYQVRCTFTLADGRETGSGEASSIDIPSGSALQISGIPQVPGSRTEVYIAPANSTVFQHAATTSSTAVTWGAGPDQLGAELTTEDLSPLPDGVSVVQVWGGRAYAAVYLPQQHQSVVWFSEPLAPHLFDLATSFFMVPGRVSMLAPHPAGLVVGTDSHVLAYTGEALTVLADYGVVPGDSWATAGSAGAERLLIWTVRGMCQYPEFQNLTERRVSVAPGVRACAAVISEHGGERFVVALQRGGTAFNPRPT